MNRYTFKSGDKIIEGIGDDIISGGKDAGIRISRVDGLVDGTVKSVWGFTEGDLYPKRYMVNII